MQLPLGLVPLGSLQNSRYSKLLFWNDIYTLLISHCAVLWYGTREGKGGCHRHFTPSLQTSRAQTGKRILTHSSSVFFAYLYFARKCWYQSTTSIYFTNYNLVSRWKLSLVALQTGTCLIEQMSFALSKVVQKTIWTLGVYRCKMAFFKRAWQKVHLCRQIYFSFFQIWQLVILEPLGVQERNVPYFKGLVSANLNPRAQGHDRTSILCHALLKKAILHL